MKQIDRKKIKALIELSMNFEKADEVMSEFTDFKTAKEKIAFLRGMFDVEILDQKEDDSDELVYELLLTTIVRKKFL